MNRALTLLPMFSALCALPAFAQEIQVVGFTKDSSAVVFYRYESSACGTKDETVVVALDLRTGREQKFETSDRLDGNEAEGALLEPVAALSAAFDAWRKTHPMVNSKPSRVSPDGKSQAVVVFSQASGDGSWDKQGTWLSGVNSAWGLAVSRDGAIHKVASSGGGDRLKVCWSPDGKRTVWVVRQYHGRELDATDELSIGTDGAPSVGVAAERPEIGEQAARKLLAAGFEVLSVTQVKKRRDATTIYAAKGQEDLAKKASELFPGSAIEPMDWNSRYDVVVALGSGVAGKSTAPNGSGACPAGMALVPGGMHTRPKGEQVKVADLCVDVTAVTVDAYAACVKTAKCNDSGLSCLKGANWGASERGSHPINCADWNQATSYCTAMGKRLPTAVEREWIARGGPKASKYPWGEEEPGSQLCWNGEGNELGKGKRRGTCPVGAFPKGDSPQGIHDLSGNVFEWTSSPYHSGSSSYARYGGCWGSSGAMVVSWDFPLGSAPSDRDLNSGFRCVSESAPGK